MVTDTATPAWLRRQLREMPQEARERLVETAKIRRIAVKWGGGTMSDPLYEELLKSYTLTGETTVRINMKEEN